jgi:hypothetical protein
MRGDSLLHNASQPLTITQLSILRCVTAQLQPQLWGKETYIREKSFLAKQYKNRIRKKYGIKDQFGNLP